MYAGSVYKRYEERAIAFSVESSLLVILKYFWNTNDNSPNDSFNSIITEKYKKQNHWLEYLYEKISVFLDDLYLPVGEKNDI